MLGMAECCLCRYLSVLTLQPRIFQFTRHQPSSVPWGLGPECPCAPSGQGLPGESLPLRSCTRAAEVLSCRLSFALSRWPGAKLKPLVAATGGTKAKPLAAATGGSGSQLSPPGTATGQEGEAAPNFPVARSASPAPLKACVAQMFWSKYSVGLSNRSGGFAWRVGPGERFPQPAGQLLPHTEAAW